MSLKWVRTEKGRQFTPIVDDFVDMLATADDGVWFLADGMIRRGRCAHRRPFLGLLDHLRAVDDVADIALEITEERQTISLGLDEVVDRDALRL